MTVTAAAMAALESADPAEKTAAARVMAAGWRDGAIGEIALQEGAQ